MAGYGDEAAVGATGVEGGVTGTVTGDVFRLVLSALETMRKTGGEGRAGFPTCTTGVIARCVST